MKKIQLSKQKIKLPELIIFNLSVNLIAILVNNFMYGVYFIFFHWIDTIYIFLYNGQWFYISKYNKKSRVNLIKTCACKKNPKIWKKLQLTN